MRENGQYLSSENVFHSSWHISLTLPASHTWASAKCFKNKYNARSFILDRTSFTHACRGKVWKKIYSPHKAEHSPSNFQNHIKTILKNCCQQLRVFLVLQISKKHARPFMFSFLKTLPNLFDIIKMLSSRPIVCDAKSWYPWRCKKKMGNTFWIFKSDELHAYIADKVKAC